MAARPPRRRSRLLTVTLVGLGLVAVAAAALWLLLPAILAPLAKERLAELGVPDPRLTVRSIGLDRARLVAVAVGRDDELTVQEITISYELAGLVEGRVDGITLHRPRLRASVGPDGLSLGSLDPLLAGRDTGGVASLPPIRIEDAEVELATPLGPVALTGAGTVATAPEAMLADLRVAVAAAQGSGEGELELRVVGSMVEARLALADSRLELPGIVSAAATGDVAARLAGGAIVALDGRVELASVAFETPGLAPLGPLAGDLTLARSADSWMASARLAEPGGEAELAVRLATEKLDLGLPVTMAAEIEATSDSATWRLLDHPALNRGRGVARLVAEVTPSVLIDSIGAGELPDAAGSVSFEIEDLSVDGTVHAVSAAGGFDLDLARDRLNLVPAAPVLADLALDRPLLDAGMPTELAELLSRSLAVTLEPGGPIELHRESGAWILTGPVAATVDLPDGRRLLDLAGTARLDTGTPRGPTVRLSDLDGRLALPAMGSLPAGSLVATGSAELAKDTATAALTVGGTASELRMGDLRFAGLKLDLPLALGWDGGRFTARLAERGTVSAERLSGSTPLQLEGPVQLAFIPGDLPSAAMDASTDGTRLTTIDLRTAPLQLSGALGTEHGPVAGTLSLPGLRIHAERDPAGWSAEMTGKGGTLRVPAYDLEATDLDLSAALPRGQAPRLSAAASLAHRGDPPIVIPLSASVEARKAARGWEFEGRATDAFGRLSLEIAGRHDLSRAAGSATLRVAPIEFAPNVRQPGDLFPYLAGVAEDVSGTIALAGDMSWNAERIGSDLELLLRDVSASTAAATIDRLNGVITVDGLSPFTTPPGQRVAVAAIDAGLPLTDGLLTFRVAPGPKLEIADGRLHLAGGTVDLEPLVFDPSGRSNAAVLAVTGVRLGELLSLAQIDGLSGDGTLTGEIPVRLDGGDIVIEHGELHAEAPGRLSYDPLSPPAALQGQGETVSLALSALTDFRYEELRVTVDRQAGGEMLVGMHVRGSNPGFYDGYPVEFNLTVSGALDRVLRQGLAGYRIPETIEDRLKEFAQ